MIGLKFDFTNIYEEAVPTHGIARSEVDLFTGSSKVEKAVQDILAERKGEGPDPFMFYHLPYDKDTILRVEEYARKVGKKFDTLVILGIGGSALGAYALANALKNLYHNELDANQRKGMKLYILDNVDPLLIRETLARINWKTTLFNVISKSGETIETLSQFLTVFEELKTRFGEKYADHLVITTDKERGILRKFAVKNKVASFEIPAGIGGRFSVLSAVGLLPARLIGINIAHLLTGAQNIDIELINNPHPAKNPILLGGIVDYLMYIKRKKTISVMMPYSNKLRGFAMWHSQLWAESLGKKTDLSKKDIYTGPTPLACLGATDQHSQLQLLCEGPHNKIITIVEVGEFAHTVTIAKKSAFPEGKYLEKKSFNQLIHAECVGTTQALTTAKRPNVTIVLPKLDEYSIGELIQYFEIKTAFAGHLFNVNPYNQPGVEAGKKIAYELMGKK